MASGALKDYLGVGLAAARPVTLSLATGTAGYYFATDTATMSVWSGVAWITVSTGAGGGVWTLLNSWDFSVSGAISQLDTINITQSEVMAVGLSVTRAGASPALAQFSTNNGVSFFSGATDYQIIANGNGATSTSTNFGLTTNVAGATPISFIANFQALQSTGPKMMSYTTQSGQGVFTGSTAAVNAVRLLTNGTTYNGGKLWVYAR
jgi:hypothetical protein